jgi:hypothetical protein
VDASAAPGWMQRVEAAMAQAGSVRLAGAGEVADLGLRLVEREGRARCEILDATEAPFGAGRYMADRLRQDIADAEDLLLLAARVEALARREELLSVARLYEDAEPRLVVELARLVPATGKEPQDELVVDLPGLPEGLSRAHARTVAGDAARPEWASLREGDHVTFRVRNETLGTWYAVVFNLQPSGKLARIFPDAGREDEGRVPPRTSRTFAPAVVVLEDPGQVDTYLCFLSEQPGAMNRLGVFPPLPAEEESAATVRGAGEPTPQFLEEWLDRVRGSGVRGGSPGGRLAVRRFSLRVEGAP